MEEDYIFENEVDEVGAPDPSNGSDDLTEPSVSDDQIIDALRSLINENDIEGDSLSGDEVIEESSSEDSEVVEDIDYTELLTDIKYELIEVNSHLDSIETYQQTNIFDRQLNDFNVTDSLLVIVCLFFLVKVFIEFIKHFTPKLWK